MEEAGEAAKQAATELAAEQAASEAASEQSATEEELAEEDPAEEEPSAAAVPTDVECLICFDTVPASDSMSLCASRHRFCADCCWRCCKSAVGDGLVPACPLDKEHSCGSVAKSTAVDALSRWLSQRGQTQARKAELHAESSTWAIRGSSVCGFTSGKLEEVYAASERAAKGAVQCPGRKCKGAWYVPAVPHSTEP